MALHRGIQSAIFYYVSCTPCTGYNVRQRRKKQALREREDMEELRTQNPGRYYEPFQTNDGWTQEILLGPGPPQRKKKAADSVSESQQRLKTAGTQSSVGSNMACSVDVDASHKLDDRHDSKRNFNSPEQREDEELWGSIDGSASTIGVGHVVTRPPTARSNNSHVTSYSSGRNPPISDLHPPVVTKYETQEEVMWMLQPPPIAAVMSGKERIARSRSNSGSSGPSRNGGSIKLSRQVSRRILERKMKEGDALSAPAMSRESSRQTAAGQISEESAQSTTTLVHNMRLDDEPRSALRARRAASRPQLSTIASDNMTAESNAMSEITMADDVDEMDVPEWVGGHVRREVKHRWSMDI